MWNQSPGDPYQSGDETGGYAPPPQPSAAPAPDPNVFAEVSWTAEQLQRMEGEWRRLQRAFAYHPHVTLTPMRDDPPSAYQVDYRLTTLIVNPRSSQLEYVSNATVQVILPPGFPNDGPVVRPVTPIFHPNVSYEGVYVEGLWHPNETLLGLIRKVGDILAYRSFDPDYAVNPAALDWLAANQEILPIDQQANLSPAAGGEPLARICKYGPQSLDSMKQSIVQTQASLLSNTPPEPQIIREYSHKTRLALNLFLEKDVPDDVQSLASELEQAARELVDFLPLCAFVRERKRQVTTLRQTARQLQGLRDPLLAEIDKLVGLVEAGDPTEPMVALKLIPEAAKLHPLQLSLPKLIGDADKRVEAIRSGLDALKSPDAQPNMIPPDSLLGKRLDRELSTGAAEVETATQESTAALAELEPVIRRATIEAVALDFAARWREYMDMASKAKAMERQVREWGAEGLQAYYISNEGGRYGPYQFEQPVDLGTGDLVLRCNGGKSIELRDPRTDKVLGQSKNGSLLINLAPAEPQMESFEGEAAPQNFPTQFTMTERCDDLMVLLEFLRRSTIETVQKFATYNGAAESWAGKVCRLLARPDVRKALEDELARAARRWRHTIVDLAALGPWKQRLATYFLLHRCSETFPHLVSTIQDRKQAHTASKKRLNEIMARCSRDLETGRMIVPPKLSKQYNEELRLQEECVTTVKSATTLLKSLVAQIKARLENPKLLGKAAQLQLRAVPPLPEALATLAIDDATLAGLIIPLEEQIQLPLGGPRPPVEEASAAAVGDATYEAAEAADGYEQDAQAYAESGEAYSEGGEGYAQGGAYGDSSQAEGFAADSTEAADSFTVADQGHTVEGGELAGSSEGYAGEGGFNFDESETSVPEGAAAEPGSRAEPAHAAAAVRPMLSNTAPANEETLPPPVAEVPHEQEHASAGGAMVVDDQWFIADEAESSAGADQEHSEQNHDLVFGFDDEPAAPTPPVNPHPKPPAQKQ